MKAPSRAFTLIELLVVIAIIAILAAILFPVFAQAKAAAKNSADLSNHKQLVTAIMLYAGDNDDNTCRTRHDLEVGEPLSNLYTWYMPLQPYLKSKEVLKDPVVSQAPVVFPYPLDRTYWDTFRTDYVINGFFSHGANLSSFVSRPAEQIIIAERHKDFAFFDYHPWATAPDGQWERGLLDGSGYRLRDLESEVQEKDPANVGRHQRGNNYSFADGHAKHLKFAQTLDPNLPPDDPKNFGKHNIDSKESNED
ncbi:MAG: prepilin-type N-terminal cleavage/methylation domain-containing protein [Fimbriimonadaceae bacterium]|nr:prepilin-type N-terminal cleavage/methylation domain-containing protein [Fimbriimonadaceae bacterium]QYK57150.1 MAG: prepilin-type N-terminal cleavage/methylation domain-containing protein [Fimbriimonadaceae bacterium]